MDQIRYVPRAGNQKKKGGKALQERLLQLWPRPPSCKGWGWQPPRVRSKGHAQENTQGPIQGVRRLLPPEAVSLEVP